MTNEQQTPKPKVDRRKGPRVTKEELQAQIEKELREKIEVELREKIEKQVREEMVRANPPSEYRPDYQIEPVPDDPDALTFHFIEDGLNAWGRIWYRGEEVTVRRDSKEWADETDRNGFTWFTLTEAQQLDRYGVVRWRPGPWRGKPFNLEDPALDEEDRKRLMSIQRERDERMRRST